MKDRGALSDAKRRLLDRLKRADSATAPELALEFGLTDTAVRQHLEALESLGLVTRSNGPPGQRGRPPVRWHLSPSAVVLFPDRHGDLMVDLLTAIAETFGADGVDAVIATRTAHQRDSYRSALADAGGEIAVRVRRLAELRSQEGYLAEVKAEGDSFELTEHHCPICEAAQVCQGLCRNELQLFRDVLGPTVAVERTSHLLGGDTRCSYRITPRQAH